MGKARLVRQLLFASVFTGITSALTGLAGMASLQANPPEAVAQILRWQPLQKGVAVAMPTAKEAEKYTVSGEGAKPGQSVWLLKDEKGVIIRRFVDTNGDKYPDLFSYYKDGQEVYREVDSKFAGKPDTFYWLNTAGSRIGISRAGNGQIDSWQAISLEELTQEVMKAVAGKDVARYSALLITEADMQNIGLSAAETERIKTSLKNVPSQFQKIAAKLNMNDSTKWLHSETIAPSRLLAENTGWKRDVVLHGRALILCETAGKTEYIQLGI